jgi:TatD DNase family protein
MPLSTDLHNSTILHDSTMSIGKSDRCWFDSHCHFDFDVFDKNRDEQWLLLKEYGCAGLIIPGVTAKQWPRLISLCADKPWGYSLGLHPYFIEQHQEGDLNKLDNACAEQLELPAEESNLVAVGEFGLDFMLASSGHTQQVELCRQQLLIAKKYNLPVILHIRKAYDEVAAMIRSIGFTKGGIVHAFSGSYQQGMVFIGLGFKLGIGGAMSSCWRHNSTCCVCPDDANIKSRPNSPTATRFDSSAGSSSCSAHALSSLFKSPSWCCSIK